MLHAQPVQRLGHELPAAAVEGGVDHLEGVGDLGDALAVVDHGEDVGHKRAVRLLTDDLDQSGSLRLVERHTLHAREDVDLLKLGGDGGGVLRRQLRAVGPVDLVAVILLGVVAGGDVDARLAAVVPHGERQLRRGAQRLEDAHMDAVCGADLGRSAGEVHRVVAAVHADGDAAALGLLALGADYLRKALRRPADDIDVHLVQTHLHRAAQTGGAELQRAVEPALDLLVVVRDGPQLGALLVRDGGAADPLLIFLSVVHMHLLLSDIIRCRR